VRYCSIDIETTGIDTNNCQLLEIGVVVDDLADPQPLDKLPSFHAYILREKYTGEPYALQLHQQIFRRIYKREQPYQYLIPSAASYSMAHFLTQHFGDKKITVAGKNFANFDLRVLERELPEFKERVNLSHRTFDPSSLYFRLGDKELPSSTVCMERAGLEGEVAHTAIEDAKMVIQLLRKRYCNG
jgi:oligoribonuclease (3'-5' exoribonuclease)